MPLDLATFQRNAQPGVVDYGDGDIIHFLYRPNNVTERLIRHLHALNEAMVATDAEKTEAAAAAINDALSRLLIRWDLTRNGVPIPLTPEALSDVPLDMRMDVFKAIFPETVTDPTTASDGPPPSPAITARANGGSSSKPVSRKSPRKSRSSR